MGIRKAGKGAVRLSRILVLVFGRRQYEDLGVTPCGARLGIGRGGKGAVRLPRILVLIISAVSQVLRPGGSRDGADMARRFLGREPSSSAYFKALGIE